MPPKAKSQPVIAVVEDTAPVDELEIDAPEDDTTPDPVADLAAEAVPPVRPDGAPDLVPFHRLRRRERARLYRALDRMNVGVGVLDPDMDEATASLGTAADVMDVLADAEDVILSAAKDPAQCEAWVAGCDEENLMALLRWYTSVMNVGEAKPSSD